MAAFGAGINRPLPGRGGSPGFRFTLYAILSIVLMFLDQRGSWLERARYFLSATAYPLQLAVNSPAATWRWIADSFESREVLQAENVQLRAQLRELALRTQRYEALARENAQLRGLKEALPSVAERWLTGEIISVELNSLRQRLLINRGTRNSVFKGQAVMDDQGLVGQTIHVGPWSSEIILVTDPEHAVPVQVERTGLRTIAVGAGDARSLALPYLPSNADVRPGDLLLTSGLGGVFPHGYPVARIVAVQRDAVQPLAQVRAQPLANLDRGREVMFVWFREGHPAAPATADSAGPTAGIAKLQPQPVPVRSAAPSQASAPAAAAATPALQAPSAPASRVPVRSPADPPPVEAEATRDASPEAVTPGAPQEGE